MYDYPRVPRNRRTEAKVEKGIVAFGCLALLINIAFWATVVFVALHFITKYW